MEKLEFTLEREEIPVTIGGESYVLIELDGRERDKYLSGLSKRVKMKDGKAAGMTTLDGLQAELVAASLKKVNGDARESVSVDTIQGWPAKVGSALFEEAQRISGMDDKSQEDAEGND